MRIRETDSLICSVRNAQEYRACLYLCFFLFIFVFVFLLIHICISSSKNRKCKRVPGTDIAALQSIEAATFRAVKTIHEELSASELGESALDNQRRPENKVA